MSDLSDYPDQWECLCMIDSRGDPLPEIEVVPQERIARLTAALDEAKRGLEQIAERGTSQIPVKHPRRGEQPAYTTYRAVENEYAQIARETLSTIERGSDDK